MKKSTLRLAALATGLALAPVASLANDLSYTYVEGGLAFYPSFGSQDFIGIDVRGSAALNDDVFVFGGLKYLTDDIDLTAFHVGGGYRFAIDPQTDLWGGVTIEYQDIDGGRVCFPDGMGGVDCASVSVDDTALGLRGGFRHQLNNELELGVSARVITGDLDYVGVTGTGRYKLDEQLSLFGEVDLYDGELGLIAGLNLRF